MAKNTIHIKDFDAKDKERLYRASHKQDRTMTSIVREAVREWLFKNGFAE
jgi:hypothetical protein